MRSLVKTKVSAYLRGAPGAAAFTLTVNGTGFPSGALVEWNGSALATRSFPVLSSARVSMPCRCAEETTAACAIFVFQRTSPRSLPLALRPNLV